MPYILSVLNDREQTVYLAHDGWTSVKAQARRIGDPETALDLAQEHHARVEEVPE